MKDKVEWYGNGAAFMIEVPAGGKAEPYIAMVDDAPVIRYRMVERFTKWRGFVWNPLVELWEPTGRDTDKETCIDKIDSIITEISAQMGETPPLGDSPISVTGTSTAAVSTAGDDA